MQVQASGSTIIVCEGDFESQMDLEVALKGYSHFVELARDGQDCSDV